MSDYLIIDDVGPLLLPYQIRALKMAAHVFPHIFAVYTPRVRNNLSHNFGDLFLELPPLPPKWIAPTLRAVAELR